MSWSLSGTAFVLNNNNNTYQTNGIEAGYVLQSVVLPTSWLTISTGAIDYTHGTQVFVFRTITNSGIITITYYNSDLDKTMVVTKMVNINTLTKGAGTKTVATIGTISIGTNIIPGPSTCPLAIQDCPFVLDVYADLNDPDPLRNDKSDFYYQGSAAVKNISLSLQKGDGCGDGAWSNIVTFGTGSPGVQAYLQLNIPSWMGNKLISGTFTIGSKNFTLSFNGTYANYIAYLCSLINADGTYLAVPLSNGIIIYGKTYAAANGTHVTQTLNATSGNFKVESNNIFNPHGTNGDIDEATNTVSPVVMPVVPAKFRIVDFDYASAYDGTSVYTVPSNSTQTFSGVVFWHADCDDTNDFLNGGLTVNLQVDTGSGFTTVQTKGDHTIYSLSAPRAYAYSFSPIALNAGDKVRLTYEVSSRFNNTSHSNSGDVGVNMNVGGVGPSYWMNNAISSSTFTDWGYLQHGVNPVAGYADYFAFGFAPDFSGNPFVDEYGNKYTGLLLNWSSILQAYGTGNYRMQMTYTYIDGTQNIQYDQREFCLHNYDCNAIDGSVRIEFYTIGIRSYQGSNTYWDYGSAGEVLPNGNAIISTYPGWYSQIRLNGILYETPPSYTTEYNQYGDDQFNAKKPIIAELNPKYNLDIKPVLGWVDWYLENNMLLADTIQITDYNVSNRHIFIKAPVINEKGVTLHDDIYTNQKAVIQVHLQYGQNNLRRRND